MLARWSGWHCGSTGRSSEATGTKVGIPSFMSHANRLLQPLSHTVCLLVAALEMLWSVEAERIEALALGSEGYTAAQYADAAVKLLDAKHHAVTKQDMLAQLGRHVVGAAANEDEAVAAGKPVFQRMVEVNALSMRPKSAWAQDIPDEAFERGKTVVTAPSAMDLYCMGRMRPELDETLKEWEQKQKVGTWGK